MLINKIRDLSYDYGYGRRLTVILLESGVYWEEEEVYDYIQARLGTFDGITIVEDTSLAQKEEILKLLSLIRKDNLLKVVNIQLITQAEIEDIPANIKLKLDKIINGTIYERYTGKHFIRIGDVEVENYCLWKQGQI